MGSLFSALSSSLSGLSTITAQMQVTSANISNAGEAGYTKKTADVTSLSFGDGAGSGSTVTGYSRKTNDALFESISETTSEEAKWSKQFDLLEQVQTILGTTSGNNATLSESMSKFAAAWTQLQAQPESSILKQQVIQAADNLAQDIQSTASDVESLYRTTQNEVVNSLAQLEINLNNIKDLNQKISQLVAGGQSAGDLQDQRDQLVLEISETMEINVMDRLNGQIALYTPEGYMLLDGQAAEFSYDGQMITSTLNPGINLNTTLSGGRLEALVQFCADTGTSTVSSDPTVNVIQKLREQLDLLASSLTDTTTPGSIGYAYANATTETGDATYLFTANTPDERTSISVNASLLNGTSTIKTSCAASVSATFRDSTRSFTAPGLSMVNSSYETLTTGIVSTFQQAANSIATLSETATSQKEFLLTKYANATGVNTDEETVRLTTLQNSYAACARVMSVIQSMFDELERII